MRKFGNNGDEFWWNDEVRNLEVKLAAFFVCLLFFVLLKLEGPGSLLSLLMAGFLVLIIFSLIRMFLLERKKITALYMNKEGITIWGVFCSWNNITKVEIKCMNRGKAGPRDYIYIYFQFPEEEKERCFCIDPEKEEIMEIKIYIEAFWQYYKTN